MRMKNWLLAVSLIATFAGVGNAGDPAPYGAPCEPETQPGDGGKDLSDPINLSTGDFQHLETDLVIPGRGFDFEIKRFYRSSTGLQALSDQGNTPGLNTWQLVDAYTENPVGQHWDFNYNMRISVPSYSPLIQGTPSQPSGDPVPIDLSQTPPSSIFVFNGTGRVDNYRLYQDGSSVQNGYSYYKSDHVAKRLKFQYRERAITIKDTDLKTYRFFAAYDHNDNRLPYAGRLESIRDRNGNEMVFIWQTSSQGVERIDSVMDTLGHTINFTYHDEMFDGQASPLAGSATLGEREQLIWAIEDHADRAVVYNYSVAAGFPMLTSVTLPEIENTSEFSLPSEHERFPNGRTWSYAYDNSTGIDTDWRGRALTTITNPNGDVILENVYYKRSTGMNKNSGRVFRQKYGDAEYNYILTDLNGDFDRSFDWYQDDYYVWVNDRRGAITRLKYAGYNSSYEHHQLLEKVEYEGFVVDPDKAVWAVENNGLYTWYVYNESTHSADPYSGPVDIYRGTPVPPNTTCDWKANPNWKFTEYVLQNGDTISIDYADDNPDPLYRGAMLERKTTSADESESITEKWAYDFNLGSGCSCGNSGFATAHRDGRGFVTLREYDPLTGDLLTIYHDMPAGTPMNVVPPTDPSQAAAVESFTYNAYGQILTHTHPVKWIVNSSGTEVEHSRVDQFEYYSNPSDHANFGRLHKERVDINGEDLTTEYAYDLAGNVIKIIEPDGDVIINLYNQASELVRIQQYNAVETIVFAQTDYFYDANGNLVREEIANLDSTQSVVSANPTITTVYEYDLHDFVKTVAREAEAFNTQIVEDSVGRAAAPVASPEFVSEKWEYDLAKNIVLHSNGEAVNGSQVTNTTKYEYDARDLMIRETEGFTSAMPSVTEYAYDENMRIDTVTQDPDGLTQTQIYDVTFDAFDRVRKILDPMGNEMEYVYDDNHNLTAASICGPVGEDTISSGDVGVTLARKEFGYDARDRKISAKTIAYDYNYGGSNPICGDVPIGSAEQVTTYIYNKDSSLHEMIEQAGTAGTGANITTYYYDTASRLKEVLDGDGNLTQHTYDADSNVLTTTQTDVISDQGSMMEQFVVTNGYDALDRLVSVMDGVLNTTTMSYDSRSNMVERVDPKGNATTYTYDGLNRQLAETQTMTDTGDGSGASVGTIVRQAEYDDSNRLIKEIDDNGNETEYEYDGTNRLTSITMPGGEQYTAQYDHNGNLAVYTDARGVVTTQTFDLNNRLIQRVINNSVLPDAGTVPYITQEDFIYDGLGRVRTAINDFTKIVREYDSRSNVVREIQNADAPLFPVASDRVVEYGFDLANNTTQITYPSGRDVYRKFDDLNRLAGIYNDAAMTNDPITEFVYIGNRVQRRNHGNNTQTVYAYNGYTGASSDPNDFGFGRVASISTINTSSGIEFDAFSFTWDKNQNRTSYKDTGSGMKNRRERFLGYDSANRLISTDVDYPDPMTDFPSPTNNGVTDYALDGVHNRTAVSGFESNGAPIGSYSQSGAQAENNQYSLTPREVGGEWTYLYDANGNMVLKAQNSVADWTGDYTVDVFDTFAFLDDFNTANMDADITGDGILDTFDVFAFLDAFNANDGQSIEHWHYSYDFRNHLVFVSEELGANVMSTVTNTYDPMARRLVEEADLTGNGSADGKRQFAYGCDSLWEVIEQIDLLNSDNVLLTHVFGIGIDDEVSYRMQDLATPEDYWTHRDDLGSVTSLTNESGAVVERYEYGDYGDVRILDASGNILVGGSVYNIHHLYTGRSKIPGAGLMDYRYRVYSPEIGRFVQRDPLGYIDSMSMYAYVIDGPYLYYDPFGLSYWEDFKDGFRVILDTIDGTHGEETNRHANEITRFTMINAKKARDRGDDCWAKQILLAGLADANRIAGDGVALADQAVDAIQQVVDEIITAPIPGPGLPGGGKVLTQYPKPSLSATKKALRKVHAITGKIKGKSTPSKFGGGGMKKSADNKRGYRLDNSGHPPGSNHPNGKPPHIDYFDWTSGKRGKGGSHGTIDIN